MSNRGFVSALWLFATLISVASAWEHASRETVQSALRGNEVVVVAYVDPSTEKAKALEIEWPEVAAEARVPLMSVDCTVTPEVCESHVGPDSDSAATAIKLFRGDEEASGYQGPRRASAILAWIDRVQRPVVTELNSEASSLEAFQRLDEVVFVAFLPPDTDTDGRGGGFGATFRQIAEKFSGEFSFGAISTTPGSEQTAKIVCYRHLDGMTDELRDNVADADAVEKFVIESSRRVIGELLPHNQQRFIDRGWPIVYVFGATEKERSDLRASLKDVARKQYKSLTAVTVDPLEFPDLQAKLGLEPGVFPAGALHQLSKDRIFPYPKGREITPRELQSWGLDVWQGRIQPWTPPGATTTTTHGNLGGGIQATQRVSMRNLNIPGVKIKIGGRDEL